MITFFELMYFGFWLFGLLCGWAIVKGLSDD
jgi:hypothetical protein